MRQSREEAARTHARIVEKAAVLFRERGIDGIGLADLMQEAGLTHGGFYKHFESKDGLAAEACAHGLAESARRMRRRAMLGAVVLARGVSDPKLRRALIDSMRRRLLPGSPAKPRKGQNHGG
jgi:AcrR family transcriptional regulator